MNGKKNQNEPSKLFGFVRWDTNKEFDIEDWVGLFGTFTDLGGIEISSEYQFRFILDDGTLKPTQ